LWILSAWSPWVVLRGGPAHRGPRGVVPGGATPYQGPILCAEKKPATLSGAGSNPSAAVQRDQLP